MGQEKLKTAFKDMAEAVAQNPQMAQASALATVELSGGVKCLAKVRDFQLTVDEPSEMGGTDQGMNPVELLLAALGACQEIGYAYFAAVMGIPLKRSSAVSRATWIFGAYLLWTIPLRLDTPTYPARRLSRAMRMKRP
jgi:hypothetical protein